MLLVSTVANIVFAATVYEATFARNYKSTVILFYALCARPKRTEVTPSVVRVFASVEVLPLTELSGI